MIDMWWVNEMWYKYDLINIYIYNILYIIYYIFYIFYNLLWTFHDPRAPLKLHWSSIWAPFELLLSSIGLHLASIGLHLSSIWAPFELHWTPFELHSKSLKMCFQGETQSTIRSGPLALRRADRPHKQGEIMVFFPFFIPEGLGGLLNPFKIQLTLGPKMHCP